MNLPTNSTLRQLHFFFLQLPYLNYLLARTSWPSVWLWNCQSFERNKLHGSNGEKLALITWLNGHITQRFHSSCCSTSVQKPGTKGDIYFAAQAIRWVHVCIINEASGGLPQASAWGHQQQKYRDVGKTMGCTGLFGPVCSMDTFGLTAADAAHEFTWILGDFGWLVSPQAQRHGGTAIL